MDLANSITHDLDTDLTPAEVLERHDQLARTVKDTERAEEEQKKVTKHHSQIVTDLKTRIRRLATAITTGKESRPVLCYERADVRRFTVEIVRKDTGAVIDTKPMTGDQVEEARQANLFGTGVRVATEKKGLDLESPPPAIAKPVEAPATDEPDDAAITNPDGLLNGEQAEKAKKKARKSSKKGLNVSSAEDIAKAVEQDAKEDAAAAPAGAKHWPDCALNHGGAACDMGPDCGKSDAEINASEPAAPTSSVQVAAPEAEDADVDESDLEPQDET